ATVPGSGYSGAPLELIRHHRSLWTIAIGSVSMDEDNAPRKVALVANCLLNQNAKVCEGARYRGLVSPVVEALRSRGYLLQQLPCPELAFAGVRRWWAVYEQYDTPAYRAHCRRLAQAVAPLIEEYIRAGDDVILIGLDGSPSSGVRFTSSQPDWGGRPNRP